MKPVVDRLVSANQGNIDMHIYAEADKDGQAASFAQAHGINAVPTLVVVDTDGREIERFVGSTPEATIQRALDSVAQTGRAVNAAEQGTP